MGICTQLYSPQQTSAAGKRSFLSARGPAREGKPLRTQEISITVPTLSINSGLSYRLNGFVATEFIVDTGASVSLLRKDFWGQASKMDSTQAKIMQWTEVSRC